MKLKGMNRTHVILLIILVVAGVFGSLGVYYVYQYTLQPNIQVTAASVNTSVTHPETVTWREVGRITGMGSFNYVPVNMTGEYVLVFSNAFSSSGRFINLTYTTHWPDYLWTSFTIAPGQSRTVQVHVNSGQQLGGDFGVSGGSGNDIDFQIIAYTCTESVYFSASLINTGSLDGFAEVAFTVDGATAWSYRYLVPVGSTIPINGNVMIDNCIAHQFNIVLQK